MTGLIGDALLFIPSVFIVAVFRKIRSRPFRFQSSSLFQSLAHIRATYDDTFEDDPKSRRYRDQGYPRWLLLVVYGLSSILVAVAALFTAIRGAAFDDLKARRWLGSLTIGVLSTVFLSQPIKASIAFCCLANSVCCI